MKRLMEKIVFCGLVTACRLATWPTSRSPSLVKPTTEGVVRPPSALGMTTGSPPSITATQELVVPRSIPMTFPTFRPPLVRAGAASCTAGSGSSDRCYVILFASTRMYLFARWRRRFRLIFLLAGCSAFGFCHAHQRWPQHTIVQVIAALIFGGDGSVRISVRLFVCDRFMLGWIEGVAWLRFKG